uniref:Uncharacterized protein n=1 Tax=Rhizophagus irregularis (strain DAOM 181602 / DAOM 197198 / MUCL 43194) TaxID=747089 RepID=U9UTE5_RHIID
MYYTLYYHSQHGPYFDDDIVIWNSRIFKIRYSEDHFSMLYYEDLWVVDSKGSFIKLIEIVRKEKDISTQTTTTVKVLPAGDELLRVINNSLFNNYWNISFSDKWNFSMEGVKKFLKDWKSKNRLPIKFTPYYHNERNFYWTVEHDRLVESRRLQSIFNQSKS